MKKDFKVIETSIGELSAAMEKGEPFGITFTGGAFSEATLLKLAYGYEQNTKKRVAPKL